MFRTVYKTPYAIPELGAKVDDIIIVEPSHPDTPLVVGHRDETGWGIASTSEFDRNQLPLILDHLDHLIPLMEVDLRTA